MRPATPPIRWRRSALLSSLILTASCLQLSSAPHRAGAQVAAEDEGQCRSSIAARFNATAIGVGNTVWFSSVLQLSDAPDSAALTVRFDQASVRYVANGATTTVPAPSGVVAFSPSATAASSSYDAGANTWYTTVPAGLDRPIFLSGLAVPLPAGMPGGVHPVIWAGRFSTNRRRAQVNWRWAAAAYTQFGADYNALGVKPVSTGRASDRHSDDHANGITSDNAGTPENERAFVIAGAMGTGGSNYTGFYSHTESSEPCRLPPPVTASPTATPTTTATATLTATATPTSSATPPPPTATPSSNCTTDNPPVCITDFSASATSVPVNTAVQLTASANMDVASSSDYIDIVDQSGTLLAHCGAGSSCSATVSSTSATTNQYTAYLAQACYPGCGIDAQSGIISVSWK